MQQFPPNAWARLLTSSVPYFSAISEEQSYRELNFTEKKEDRVGLFHRHLIWCSPKIMADHGVTPNADICSWAFIVQLVRSRSLCAAGPSGRPPLTFFCDMWGKKPYEGFDLDSLNQEETMLGFPHETRSYTHPSRLLA